MQTENFTRLPETKDAIREVAGELAEMIRRAPNPNKRLPRSDWTIAETAAHLAFAQRGMGQIGTGEIENPYADATIYDFAGINDSYLQSSPERDTPTLARLIDEGTEEFLATLAGLPELQRVPSPMGTMEVATLYVYNLAHLLMHGHPLAKALGKPSPVTRARALLAMPFLTAVVPKVFNAAAAPGLAACFELRMRGGPRFAILFENGRGSVEATPSGRVDCRISADPSAFFLVGAGVIPQWGPIAQGKMLAWGRKPWIAFRLKSLLPNP